MRVEKITTIKSTDLDFRDITLLTKEEAEALPIDIRKCKCDWWLRSPGGDDGIGAVVVAGGSGEILPNGGIVTISLGVRPALRCNLLPPNLQIGDKVIIFGYVWTVITEHLILCDAIVGESPFRKDWCASDANDYEASDIKKWLEEWYFRLYWLAESENKKMSNLETAIKIIKAFYRDADCGIFNSQNILGDAMTTIYEGEGLTIKICYHYAYFEVFGLSDADFRALEKYYNSLREK